MTGLIIALFIVTALLSIPIAHALVLASVGGLLIIDKVPVHLAIEQMLSQTQSFPLIAIPFFMMTGALMVSGKLGQSLVSLLSMMIGRIHGGPAQVGVLSSTIFGGVSGSAVADASAIGSMLIPWLKKLGYPGPFAAGTLAAAATIDILIPPSIPMIVYALVSGASIGALFVAGILPGLLIYLKGPVDLNGRIHELLTQLRARPSAYFSRRRAGLKNRGRGLASGRICEESALL